MNIDHSIYLILILFGLLVAVLGLLLPFSVFGVKPLLRELVKQQQRTNALLEKAERERGTPP